MTVKEFIDEFVYPGSLVRLWRPIKHGHEMLTNGSVADNDITELPDISNSKFLYIADIYCDRTNDAINIVIDTDIERKYIVNAIDQLRRTREAETYVNILG